MISAPPGIPTGGQTLGAEVRKFMEPRFGASFGGVRIHTDDTAAHLSQQMQARAGAIEALMLASGTLTDTGFVGSATQRARGSSDGVDFDCTSDYELTGRRTR